MGYSFLYDSVIEFGNVTQSNTREYLKRYFNKYDHDLEKFISHFELPSNATGVIVLSDGELLAIDKFPSRYYLSRVWEPLVRDCYSVVAITTALKGDSRVNMADFSDSIQSALSDSDGDKYKIADAARLTKQWVTGIHSEFSARIASTLRAIFSMGVDVHGTGGDTVSVSGVGEFKVEFFKVGGGVFFGNYVKTGSWYHLVSMYREKSFEDVARSIEWEALAREQEPLEV